MKTKDKYRERVEEIKGKVTPLVEWAIEKDGINPDLYAGLAALSEDGVCLLHAVATGFKDSVSESAPLLEALKAEIGGQRFGQASDEVSAFLLILSGTLKEGDPLDR